MRKTFKYRLYPNKQQRRLLDQQLEECRWLYNHLLAARRDAWQERQESLRLYDQQATLPALKAERPALASVQSQVLQNVAVRIDLAFHAFFRRMKAERTKAERTKAERIKAERIKAERIKAERIKAGEQEPGYPRFRGKGRYDSITFPQVPVGCRLEAADKRPRIANVRIANVRIANVRIANVRIANVGRVKVLLHRPLEGTPKTATIRRSGTGKWYASFSCECAEPAPLAPTSQHVGIDVGLKTFATFSTGQEIANPRFFRVEERALAKAQRRSSKTEKGTPQRAERRKMVARVHERIAWRRGDFAHQHSRRIVNHFDLIAVEDVSVNRMMHTHCLAKSIADAAWTQFAATLSHKAAWAGRRCVAVNPAYTSQDCSGCGHRQKLSLADRTYTCPCCGLAIDRDLNAARNILALGQQCLASA